MLSPYAADAVRATIPVVAQYQGEMTRKFYGIMAATHPPVLQAFDRGFQEAGVDREALMSAVLHYARRVPRGTRLDRHRQANRDPASRSGRYGWKGRRS